MRTPTSAVLGGLFGNLSGDMIGVPYETKKPSEIPYLPTDLLTVPPLPFERSHPAQPPHVYSDDGSCTLCLWDSLLAHDGLHLDDFGRRMLRWLDTGYMAALGTAFGSGGTTREALARIRAGCSADEAGLQTETAMGNGPIMRGLPIALWAFAHHPEFNEVAVGQLAMSQCLVTHAHPRAQVTTAAYTLWAWTLLNEPERDPVACAYQATQSMLTWINGLEHEQEVYDLLKALEGRSMKPTGQGHIIDTFITAIACQRTSTFEDVIRMAITFGHDTDTTAAVAGGIAGIRWGVESIPAAWRLAILSVAPPEAQALLRVYPPIP